MFQKGLSSLAIFFLLAMTTACGGAVKSSEPTEVIEFRQVLAEVSASTSQVEVFGEIYSNISCENIPKPVNKKVDLIACDRFETVIYFLGPIALDGNSIDSSESMPGEEAFSSIDSPGRFSDAAWAVNIDFKDEGAKAFADLTTRVTSLASPMNQIAITQGTLVITAPRINEAITAGSAQITGNFTMEEARALAYAIQNKKPLPEFLRRR
jgi:preprotein translocase subunit SecD